MKLTPELQKMFEEKTKKLSLAFHEANCCNEQIRDFDKLKECLEIAKPYINHFRDYYFPQIESEQGLETMIYDLKQKDQEYIKNCMKFDEIPSDANVDELLGCLKNACDYIKEIESDLIELGFKLS